MMKILYSFLDGLRSLGCIGGDNSLFNEYLRGNNVTDMRKDWEAIGNDMRKVMGMGTKYRKLSKNR